MEQQNAQGGEPRESRRKVPGWVKLVAVVLALAGSVGYGFYKVGAGISDPGMIAREYVRDLAAGSYETAYKQLKVEDGTWFTKEKFAQAMDDSFAQCAIRDISAKKGRKVREKGKLPTRSVDVTFTTDTGEQRQWQVQLVQDGKLLGIYDHWRVVPAEIMQEGWTLTVPSGAHLSLDQVEIGEQYRRESKPYDGEASRAAQDVYVLPQIFRGVHRVQVTMDNCQPLSQQLSTENSQFLRMEPEDWFYDAVAKKLAKAQEVVFAAVLDGGSLEKLEQYADPSSEFYKKAQARHSGADKSYDKWKKIKVDGVSVDRFEVLDSRYIRVDYTIRETRTAKGSALGEAKTEKASVLMENRDDSYVIVGE